ncbi:MAG: cupin domain-containing protein [Bacteroidota bacterium]
MHFKSTDEANAFTAGDFTTIKELLHPKNETVEINYSLAHAELAAGQRSHNHILEKQSELYYILEGRGEAHIGETVQMMKKGDFVLIPAGVEQYIINVGEETLRFLCIVSPPWKKEDEKILEE